MEILDRLLTRLFYLISRVVEARPVLRAVVLASLYSTVLAVAFISSYLLRWDFYLPLGYWEQCLWLLAPVVLCKLMLLGSFGQFPALLSNFSLHDFARIVLVTGLATGAMLVVWMFSAEGAAPPRSVILIDSILSVGGLGALRLGLRLLHDHSVRINCHMDVGTGR